LKFIQKTSCHAGGLSLYGMTRYIVLLNIAIMIQVEKRKYIPTAEEDDLILVWENIVSQNR